MVLVLVVVPHSQHGRTELANGQVVKDISEDSVISLGATGTSWGFNSTEYAALMVRSRYKKQKERAIKHAYVCIFTFQERLGHLHAPATLPRLNGPTLSSRRGGSRYDRNPLGRIDAIHSKGVGLLVDRTTSYAWQAQARCGEQCGCQRAEGEFERICNSFGGSLPSRTLHSRETAVMYRGRKNLARQDYSSIRQGIDWPRQKGTAGPVNYQPTVRLLNPIKRHRIVTSPVRSPLRSFSAAVYLFSLAFTGQCPNNACQEVGLRA